MKFQTYSVLIRPVVDSGAPRMIRHRLSLASGKGLGFYSQANELASYWFTGCWQKTESWVRDEGLHYSWQSKLNECYDGLGSPCPSSPPGAI